jgi:hypothetical protein
VVEESFGPVLLVSEALEGLPEGFEYVIPVSAVPLPLLLGTDKPPVVSLGPRVVVDAEVAEDSEAVVCVAVIVGPVVLSSVEPPLFEVRDVPLVPGLSVDKVVPEGLGYVILVVVVLEPGPSELVELADPG